MSRISVPFDFSDNARRAFQQAVFVASASGATVELLHITNSNLAKEYPEGWGEISEAQLRGKLEEAAAASPEEGVSVTVRIISSTLIAGGIISHTQETKPDLLVMGTHGWSGVEDKLLGSNTSSLINHALFPILAIPANWEPARLTGGIAAVELKDLNRLMTSIEKWGAFMGTPVEIVEFSAIPQIDEPASAYPSEGSEVTIRGIVKLLDDLSLAENIAQFVSAHENTYCMMFVHERGWLKKLFDGSISEKVSGMIESPLLALPEPKIS